MAGEPLPFDDSLPPGGNEGDGLEHEDIGAGDEFILEAGGHSIERHLSREQKLRRGFIGVLVVAIAAYWLLGGASSTLSWLASLRASTSQSSVPNNSPPMLKHGPANPGMIPLPPGVTNNLTLKLAPANGADGYVYSCWSGGRASNQPIRYRLYVGLYTRATKVWKQLPTPTSTASVCEIVSDREREAGVLLAVWSVKQSSSSVCQLPQLFHSDDAGQFWSAVPWPGVIEPTCNPEFFLEAGRVYVQSATPLLPENQLSPDSAAGFLLTTNSDDVSWQVADSGQATDTAFHLVALRPNGRLLAESLAGSSKSYQSGLLWESEDYGRDWRLGALLPGNAPIVSVSSNPAATDHGGWGYLYVNYFASATSTVPLLSYGMLDTQGGSWKSVPLPGNIDAHAGGPMASYFGDGAEGPLESLIYLQPEGSSFHTVAPSYSPWLFDAAKMGWLLDPDPIPADSLTVGVSWQGGVMTLLVTAISENMEPSFLTYSLTLSPRQFGAST